MSSPILRRESALAIFRNEELRKRFLALERLDLIEDDSVELSQLVNTTQSKNDALSRWVRYREGYSPLIVKRILEEFPINVVTDFVFDPMCGSGSTQVAAQQMGVVSFGTDISPYAVLVSKVKTTPLNEDQMAYVSESVLNLKKSNLPHPTLSSTDEFLKEFFPSRNFREMASIRDWIGHQFRHDENVADFVRVALLSIVEDSSNRKKDGNGLATRPAVTNQPLDAFKRRITEMLLDMRSSAWMSNPSKTIRRSALEIDKSIDFATRESGKRLGAVIFSPPYANSFDYYDSYKLELLFGEFFTCDDLAKEKKALIRNYRQMGSSEPLVNFPTLELLIDELNERVPEKEKLSGNRDGRSRLLPNMLRGYFEDMHNFLVMAYKSMPRGSYMTIVVDQSAYLGVLIPTDLLLVEDAEGIGFQLRRVIICRRAKTSGQQLRMQPALGEVLREAAVVLFRV